ncbi:MAG TPA: hypothetical protein VMF58_17175 [Rhizomicrobium sp.]|nr:hypothetical protein [Rhizomicrobium sp.]
MSSVSPAHSATGLAQVIRDAFADAIAMLFATATFEPHRSLESEVYELVEPHLAILVHKRRKYFGEDARDHELWAKELDAFVGRTFFWPTPAATEAFVKCDRRKIGAMVDKIVAHAQFKQDIAEAVLPQTSRFGASWAD